MDALTTFSKVVNEATSLLGESGFPMQAPL